MMVTAHRVYGFVALVALAASLPHLTALAQTVATSSFSVATSTTTGAIGTSSLDMIVGTSTPAGPAPVGAEVPVGWSQLLPERPWHISMDGANYLVSVDDLAHDSGTLLLISPSGKTTKITSYPNEILGAAPDGTHYVFTDRDGNLLRAAASSTPKKIAIGVTTPDFASDVGVTSTGYVVTDYPTGRLQSVAPDGSTSTIASGLRHLTQVLPDGANYIVGATDSQTYEPYLYRVSSTGTSTPIANLGPWFDFSQVTGISKDGSGYDASSDKMIVFVSASGSVSTFAELPPGVHGITNDGTHVASLDFSAPRLTLINIVIATSSATSTGTQ
jgi:hypothetical protein